MILVDSHCHLDMLDPAVAGDNVDVIARAKASGVGYFLNVCVKISDFADLLATAKKYPFVSATVGLHPNEKSEEVDEQTLYDLAGEEKVVGIGETGLDYYRSEEQSDWQQKRFRMHINVAKRRSKPLIIHTRAAKEDTIRIMQEERAEQVSGVMHCFTEDWAMAKQALDMNFYISFSGIVTFKNAVSIQEVAKLVPLDRMLIETDAPYLAPNPHRGKPNEPAYMRHTAEYIAQLRGVTLEKFAEQTTKNFFQLFSGASNPYV